MASDYSSNDSTPAFIIGHHSNKTHSISPAQTLEAAHETGYDTVTIPITTPHFHSRVLALLASCLSQQSSLQRESHGSFVHQGAIPTIPPLQPVDSILSPDESLTNVLAVSSSWIDLCSPDPLIAGISRQILLLEIAYAAFCGITYVLIPGPRWPHRNYSDGGLMQYARAVQEALNSGPYLQIQIWCPLIDPAENEWEQIGDLAPFVRQEFLEEDTEPQKLGIFGSWDAWNVVRTLCKYHPRVCVALRLPRHLPPVAIQARWHSEPVRLLSLDQGTFTKNSKGYPVLPKPQQALISRFNRLRTPPWYLLCNVDPDPDYGETDVPPSEEAIDASPIGPASQAPNHFPTLAEAAQQYPGSQGKHIDRTPHLSYMRNLQRKQPPQSAIERFGAGYQDFLQAPLQPLTVNLESITYEVFEKDPIKYEWYEKAIARALHDWVEQGKPTSREDGQVVVAVVGAGRGPLVTRALRAADAVGVSIDMWALEKNPNAFVLLSRHNDTLWNNRVKLVKSDMRTWKGPCGEGDHQVGGRLVPAGSIGQAVSSGVELRQTPSIDALRSHPVQRLDSIGVPDIKYYGIDILISELLGSFADNELSPECLDGVTHLLNPVHGISIPASYTAHLSPIAAPKLHADILTQSLSNPNAAETPYVVMLHAVDHLSTVEATAGPGAKSPIPEGLRGDAHHASPSAPMPVVRTVWSFSHPNNVTRQISPLSPPISNSHNARHSVVSFRVRDRGVCHGLAGYFETVLYPGVELSTNPVTMESKSAGMISWFPIYFPLKQPLYVPDNSLLVVNMWRQTDERRVWYEWIVEVFIWDKGFNRGSSYADYDGGKGKGVGRKVRTGMSDLHSSIKEACLM